MKREKLPLRVPEPLRQLHACCAAERDSCIEGVARMFKLRPALPGIRGLPAHWDDLEGVRCCSVGLRGTTRLVRIQPQHGFLYLICEMLTMGATHTL
eukprot:1694746-Rhodomonas_salina.3